jgi:tellurite resistance protein
MSVVLEMLGSQAGGGGAFGGGSDGGDGALPIEILFWLVRFAIHYPAVGVPLLILALVVFALGMRKGWWRHQERVIQRARPLRDQQAQMRATQVLSNDDASFDQAAFTARIESAFKKAQAAWCAQDLEPLRAFVSDGVFERFSLQIAEQRAAGWRQGMDGSRVERVSVQHVELGRSFETLTARIAFEADIHRLELASGKRISGSSLPRRHFEECWSFVRRRGAKTRGGAGLIEGMCPNCGATLALNQSAKCASCGALVRSGEFDWVLAEITQASEWRPEDEHATPGFDAYVQKDPGLSVQMLEDRVSVAFWRWSDAARTWRADPLARVATDAFLERELERLAAAKPGLPRMYLGDRAVGSVRTRGLLAAEATDRAVVEVVWDGRFTTLSPNGGVKLDEHRTLRRTLFVLERPAGARTKLEDTFTTAICPNCGAHDSGGVDPRCPYCSAPRTGGPSTWRVANIVEQGAPEHAELLRECEAARRASATVSRETPAKTAAVPAAEPAQVAAQAPAGLLAWAVAGARADGHVDASERRAIEALAARLGDPPEHLEALLSAPLDQLATPHPRDRAEAVAWLEQLCELALADGAIPRSEQDFLRHVAKHFGAGQRELADAYDSARSRLYRESKSARANAS